ncbi:MAG: hypothetical protein LBU68_00380 [Rickettsiales bacterium]|jgi:hypothetical protein|nr:hypothetical protein [Rickettsiales bacterium]
MSIINKTYIKYLRKLFLMMGIILTVDGIDSAWGQNISITMNLPPDQDCLNACKNSISSSSPHIATRYSGNRYGPCTASGSTPSTYVFSESNNSHFCYGTAYYSYNCKTTNNKNNSFSYTVSRKSGGVSGYSTMCSNDVISRCNASCNQTATGSISVSTITSNIISALSTAQAGQIVNKADSKLLADKAISGTPNGYAPFAAKIVSAISAEQVMGIYDVNRIYK